MNNTANTEKPLLGFLGNVGPGTTAKFYQYIAAHYKEEIGELPSILMSGVPLSIDQEENGIGKGDILACLPPILKSLNLLEKAEVDFIVMACNTLHVLALLIQKSTHIPFLSIVDVTCEHIDSLNIKTIGIMGTTGTKTEGLYRIPLESKGLNVIEPTNEEQKIISDIIQRLVDNCQKPNDKKTLLEIIDKMKENGAEIVLLACTDFQLIIDPSSNVIDTMRLLADACVDIMTGKRPIPNRLI